MDEQYSDKKKSSNEESDRDKMKVLSEVVIASTTYSMLSGFIASIDAGDSLAKLRADALETVQLVAPDVPEVIKKGIKDITGFYL